MKKYPDPNIQRDYPKIHFKVDSYTDFETENKGYRNDVIVELENGDFIEVFFYDVIRLKQDMGTGRYLSKPGLIVLDNVNKEAIIHSVIELNRKGFFEYFKSRDSLDVMHFEENI